MADVKEIERTRLEEKVDHIYQEVQELKRDVKELKDEIHRVETSLREEVHRLDKKFTLLILVLIFLVVFLNQNALEFILRVLGFMK